MRLANGVIEIDPEKLGGTPIFSGTRVPIQDLLDYLEAGETIEQFLDGFPPITREQVTTVLDFFKLSPDQILRPDPDGLLGEKIELRYFDQNSAFEAAFTPQECLVLGRFVCTDGTDDWYLLQLTKAFSYERKDYDYLLVRSRWSGCHLGKVETAVFIVLVPDPQALANPFQFDMKLYIAWGMATPVN